jgi:hypothetical protein
MEVFLLSMFDVVRWERIDGSPVASPFGTVTPEARAVVVRFPFGGYVWAKPVAVRIEREGVTQRLPIPDPTRQAQIGLIALIALVFVLSAVIAGKRKESR